MIDPHSQDQHILDLEKEISGLAKLDSPGYQMGSPGVRFLKWTVDEAVLQVGMPATM